MQKILYKIAIMFVLFLGIKINFCFGENLDIKVIDGDSLEIDGQRIRLIGIDAPEYTQYCFDANNNKYDCGIKAKNYLETLVFRRDFYCKTKDIDIYERKLSVCYSDGRSINKKMLEEGWAIAYRTKNPYYHDAQLKAKLNKQGIYQGKFIAPEIYRRMNKRKKS